METKRPLFSIIVPAYNIEAYIRESLLSLTGQTFADFECIIVNDGSTDETATVIRDTLEGDARFTVVTQGNGGLSNARNTGYTHANGDYVLFLDGDDVFEATLLQAIADRISTTDADIVIYNSDGLNSKTGVRTNVPNIVSDDERVLSGGTFNAQDISAHIFNTFFNSVWTKAFRRGLLDEYGLRFNDDLKRIEDLPFTNAAFVVAKKLTFINEVLLHYRYNTGTSNTTSNYRYNKDIITSATMLHDFLESHGLLETYRQSFDNAVMNDCEYYLWWVAPYDVGRETFAAIKTMLHEWEIDVHERSYFYREGLDDLRQVIANGSYDEYLRYILKNDRDTRLAMTDEKDANEKEAAETTAKLRDDLVSRDVSIAVVTRERNDAREAYDKIVTSKSYRIGNIIAKPVRVVKIALKGKGD